VHVTSHIQFESSVPILSVNRRTELTSVRRAFVLEKNLGSIKGGTRIALLYVVIIISMLGGTSRVPFIRKSTRIQYSRKIGGQTSECQDFRRFGS
jgi:hypothetical protein